MYKIPANERITAFLRTGTHPSNLCLLDSKRVNAEASDPATEVDDRKGTREDAPWQLAELICNLMNLADNL